MRLVRCLYQLSAFALQGLRVVREADAAKV